MRRCRIKLPNRCYHLISRVAHRAYFLDGDERTRLVDFARRVAEFSGVKLLAYCVMSNHFHVFVYIGRPEPLSDAEIVRRISALYSDVRFEQVMKKWNELAKRPDSPSFRRYRASFLRRMWNASEFMKTLKQHYTMSFNGRRGHYGTMWESRYRVRVRNPGECGMMLAESGYVDANPKIRATGKMLTVFKQGNRICFIAGISMSAIDIYKAESRVRESVRQVGGWTAAYVGGRIGSAVGAKAGMATAIALGQAGPQITTPEEVVTVPVFGVIGGIVGGIVGGIGGFVFGAKTAETVYDWVFTPLEKEEWEVGCEY